MIDTRSPVAPVEGHYAMLRNGYVLGPLIQYNEQFFLGPYQWNPNGSDWDDEAEFDIIATISPEAMALAANGELEELKAGVNQLERQLDANQDAFFAREAELERLRALIPLADAVCDYADSNCRWFDISTAPKDGSLVMFYVAGRTHPIFSRGDDYWASAYWLVSATHWRPLPPPPTNPPLPAVFTELGAALERLKDTNS